MAAKTRILVVDDTITYRRIMSEVVAGLPESELCGTASNGAIALKKIEQDKPDIVLMDVEMPEMDGLATLKAIRERFRSVGVIMVSGASSTSADITIKALQAGAIDFVPKPEGLGYEASILVLRKQVQQLLSLHSSRNLIAGALRSHTSNARTLPPLTPPGKVLAEPVLRALPAPRLAPTPKRFDILAIGVSTGGPEALGKLIPKLPGDLGVPILLVQHMPPVFTASLARNLSSKSQLLVKEGEEGEVPKPNTVYIAPGGHHMIIRRQSETATPTLAITDSPPVKSCRPSVDVLFRSIANVYEGNVLAAILTGMGDDGCDGVATLKRKGCYCFTQAETSCVVYGMPRAVDEAKLSDESVDLATMAERITLKLRRLA